MPNKRLVIGGPCNGEISYWLGDVVELPTGDSYRKLSLILKDKSLPVYVHSSLTEEEALKLLQENYLGV